MPESFRFHRGGRRIRRSGHRGASVGGSGVPRRAARGGRAAAGAELIPAACPALQQNPATDWMYTADAGKCGLGLTDGRMMVPRGKMLGGSSGMNYMAYVRGHPGDFDAWAEGGATGWSYHDVLPYFKKSEGLAPSDDIVDRCGGAQHRRPARCLGARRRCSPGAREFVDAAVAAGIPRGDYNGRDRGGAGRRRVAAPDHHAGRQAIEHLSRVPRRRRRTAAEPDDHHRRAGRRA